MSASLLTKGLKKQKLEPVEDKAPSNPGGVSSSSTGPNPGGISSSSSGPSNLNIIASCSAHSYHIHVKLGLSLSLGQFRLEVSFFENLGRNGTKPLHLDRALQGGDGPVQCVEQPGIHVSPIRTLASHNIGLLVSFF